MKKLLILFLFFISVSVQGQIRRYPFYISNAAQTRTASQVIEDNTPKGWYIGESDYLTRDASDSVTIWNDASSANNDLVATNNTPKQPIFVTDHVHFNGVANYMIKSFTWEQPNYIIAVIRQDGWTFGEKLIHNTTTGVAYLGQESSTPQLKLSTSAGTTAAEGNLATTAWGIVRILVVDNGGTLQIDEHDVVTFDPNTYKMGGLCIGASDVPDAFAHCSFREIICLGENPSAADIAILYSYLETKYGL